MNEANVDLMGISGGSGEVANFLAKSKLDPGQMRPWINTNGQACVTNFLGGDAKKPENYRTTLVSNASLRREEWMALDNAILPISRTRLIGVQDLIDNGLVYNLGNAMGTTVLEYHDISDGLEAIMTMDGITRSPGDRPNYTHHYLPIPIIHVDYEIGARELAISRNMGNPIDTTDAESAARRVAEKLEKLLFTDTSYSFGGGTIQSYVNASDRNQVTLDSEWTNSGVGGANIVNDVMVLKATSIAAKHYGPWMMYIPSAYEILLDADYSSAKGQNTVRERILQIAGLKGIKVVDTLAANTVLLVQMTSDVVRLVRGMGIQNIQWGEEGNFVTKFKVLTIQVPQIRADQEGNSGIVHATFTT